MSSVMMSVTPSPVLLATAEVTVHAQNGRSVVVRALLDQGSEVTFISETLAQTLRVTRTKTHTRVSAVGGASPGVCRHAAAINISPRDQLEPKFSAVAFILKSLTKYAPRLDNEISNWHHLSNLKLADRHAAGNRPIDVIIGANLYCDIILPGVRKGRKGQPTAQNSHFGWFLSGPTTAATTKPQRITVLHCSIEQELRRFWELEDVPARPMMSPEEKQCEDFFVATHSRASDGKYIVRLPFKTKPPISIGSSRAIAAHKLFSLHRRLISNPDLKRDYSNFLQEYEDLHHMIKVSDVDAGSQIVYIPHHPVIRESSSTTRLRVVFNASSLTSNGTSLNSHLEVGPKLQTDLPTILLRWRQYKYAYSADIAKMYRQIWIDQRDRNYQRILWYQEDESTLQDYQLLTVTYGTVAAPYLALRVIKQLIQDEGCQYPLAASILRDNTYVDDLLFGADNHTEAREARRQVRELLARGGFELRKWASNDPELLRDIPSQNHGLARDRSFQSEEMLAILGVAWNVATDTFHYLISLPENPPRSKRAILSMIARLFDPLEWVTPVIISAKIFIQHLWQLQLDWDDEIPQASLDHWIDIYKSLSRLNELNIPRWTGHHSEATRCELHGFADASTKAYAAVIYMRTISASGHISTRIMIGKSKVAPIKPVTIPRLELTAALLSTKLLDFVRTSLNLKDIPCYIWTDSTVVLSWINSQPSKWKTFVANRVAEIQARVPTAIWSYVATDENPADCASRGLLGPAVLSYELWWHGPAWLQSDSSEWPRSTKPHTLDIIPEERTTRVHCTQAEEPFELASRFSSWPTLLRVTAYIFRFADRSRGRKSASSAALSADEVQRARVCWLRIIQSDGFPKEIKALREGKSLPRKSSLIALRPFLDADGVVRVGGRLENAPFPFRRKHPILLVNHPVTNLLASQAHLRSLHAGIQLTLATLRQEYWIVSARNLVKRIIHQCIRCTREKATVSQQLMGQLPTARVSAPSRAFTHCGVDYAGPISTRPSSGRGIASRKGYIAVFVCLASKAIHLELVSTYATPSFIDAYTRFCARRGLPTTMYSDNGTTFTGADKELIAAYRQALHDPNFLNKTAIDKVSWKFIPPNAPHFGGLWEAGVRSLKHHLRRELGAHTLTFEEFTTLLCRIEACLNSRPIGPLKDDPEDFEPLTPGHFLVGSALNLPPEPSTLDLNENRLSRWQAIRHITEKFWKVWQSDYVNTLQQRSKWRKETPSIKPNTMVLLKNSLLPPCKWELGRVTQCHAGPDGLVRVLSVRTAKSHYKRPITSICVLPIENDPKPDAQS